MPVYERSTHVAAPFEEVWEFHSRASGLEALSPDWLDLRVEATTGPDGEADPGVLEAGSTVVSSARPFGVGPRQRWRSVILDRRETEAHALFRDEMRGGPFAEWEHTHRFSREGDGTRVHDRIAYALPGGPVGTLVSPAACVGLDPMFRYRHRRTKELLE